MGRGLDSVLNNINSKDIYKLPVRSWKGANVISNQGNANQSQSWVALHTAIIKIFKSQHQILVITQECKIVQPLWRLLAVS